MVTVPGWQAQGRNSMLGGLLVSWQPGSIMRYGGARDTYILF